MSMVVSDYFIHLEIPTFDHFVFASTKHVRMSVGYSQTTDCHDVTSKRQLELAGCQIPDLNCAVS